MARTPTMQGDIRESVSQTEADGVRTKGGVALEFYYKRDSTVLPGSVAEVYRGGDELQFVYGGAGYTYVTLASIDVHGLVSVYRTEEESQTVSVAVKPGERQPFPFGVSLDNSPGSELFVLVYSATALTSESMINWMKNGFSKASGNLDSLSNSLPQPPSSGAKVKSLLVRKAKA